MMRDQIASALLAANGSRAGASVPAQPRGVRQILIENGLMTKAGNLTAAGAMTRRSLSERMEREAFGE